MPYVFADVEKLGGQPKVGTKECVALVKHYAKAPVTTAWKQGNAVKGGTLLAKGTAIATFENGKYPNKPHGNHAALYISQNVVGIYVMDQWSNDKIKPTISKRLIRFKGKNKDGTFIGNAGDNGDAYYVVV